MQAEIHEKAVETLNDLVKINNDRIAGYQKAIEELGDANADLKAVFSDMVAESEQCKRQLLLLINKEGGEPADGATAPGAVYRVWMDLKATFSGDDRKTVLESCEFGEDAAQKAYKAALEERGELIPEAVSTIREQQQTLKISHDKIKQMRDSES